MDSRIDMNQNNFDFIRFVLAFVVMGSHICVLVPGDIYHDAHPFFQDRIAIRAFFVISGFLIAKSLSKSTSLKSYFLKRIKRIVPAYTFVVLFFALFLSLFSTLSFNDYFSSSQFWKYLGVNLIYQNYLEPCLPGVFTNPNVHCAVNGALWTIKIEEAFYLILPLLAFVQLRCFKKKWIFYLGIYILSILFFDVLTLLGYFRVAKQLPGALCFFAGGIFAYHYFEMLVPKLKYLVLPALVIFLIENYYTDLLFLSPFALAIVTLFVAYNFKFLNHFGRYGDFTYGTYIFHFPIIQLFVWTGFYQRFGKLELFLIISTIAIVCAVFSWKFIETKFISRNYLHRINKMDDKK